MSVCPDMGCFTKESNDLAKVLPEPNQKSKGLSMNRKCAQRCTIDDRTAFTEADKSASVTATVGNNNNDAILMMVVYKSRVVYNSRQLAKFARFSARFRRLLLLLHCSQDMLRRWCLSIYFSRNTGYLKTWRKHCKSWQPAKFAGFSAGFHQLLSLLHEPRYGKEMIFIRS